MSSPTPTPPEIGSRWQHAKRGTYYTVINHGYFQCSLFEAYDCEPVTIYEAEDNHSVWVRPTAEFLDGRFIQIALP